MSEFRKQIEALINSKRGTNYIISALGVTAEASSEMKDMMITELVSLVCALEDEKIELEENCNNLAMALDQVSAAFEEFYSKHTKKESLWKRISICFNRQEPS